MWIVVDIGCIECGESSDLVGVFDDEARAETVANKLNKNLSFTGGQHSYEVFKLNEVGFIQEYYLKGMEDKS